MAYQTGTYTDFNDALDKVQAFVGALSNWTVDSFIDDSTIYSGDAWTGKRLHIHNGSAYFNFRTANTQQIFEGSTAKILGIGINGSRGYNSGLSWDYQPNGKLTSSSLSTGGMAGLMVSSGSYFIFVSSDEQCITLLFESVYPDVYSKISVGYLSNGWQFYAAGIISNSILSNFSHLQMASQSYSKAVYNATVSLWSAGVDNGTVRANTFMSSLYQTTGNGELVYSYPLLAYSPNPLTGNPVLVPTHMTYINSDSEYQYIGVVPEVYFVSMRYYDNGQEVEMPNGDIYVMFTYNYGVTTLGGKGAGLAIKKVV